MDIERGAKRVLDLFAHPPHAAKIPGLVVIGIDGRSGSGKTILSREIMRLDSRVSTLELENFYAGWSGLASSPKRLITSVLMPWRNNRVAKTRFWDWHAQEWEQEPRHLPPPDEDFLLIEGCGVGAVELAPFLNALVWLEADRETRFSRAISRDGATFAPYWQMWADQEEEMLARNAPRSRADLVLRL